MATKPSAFVSRQNELLRSIQELKRQSTRQLEQLRLQSKKLMAQRTKLMETQEALLESRDSYADLLDFTPIGLVTLDATGMVKSMNQPARCLLGLEQSRVVGLPFMTFVDRPQWEVFLDYMTRCRRAALREQVALETLVRPRYGEAIPVELKTRPMTGGTTRIYPTAIVDLSDRKRLEEERVQAQEDRLRAYEERLRALHDQRALQDASEAKDRFIATLSHELRTPLTSIVFALGSLRQGAEVPAELRTTFQLVSRNVELETRLIDDLLDVTRIQRGKLRLERRPIHAHDLVREIVEMSRDEARARHIDVHLDLSAPQDSVDGDAIRLRQVLWNVVTNGLRHTAAGGRITLCSQNPEPGRFAIIVRDTGEGIPQDMLERVFEPFEQVSEPAPGSGNLGLGLAISRGIVDAHGGRIQADSEGLGRGATFTVDLPVSTADNGAAAPRPAPPVTETLRRILLVEDNHDNGMAVAEFLRVRGYEVEVAGSIRAAVAIADRQFDVVLSDIGLPDGTGRDLVRRLRERGPVRAVALTGYGTPEDVARNLEAGFRRHLTKPVDPEALIDAIEAVAAEDDAVVPARGMGNESGCA